eukprot:m.40230 g.40230  ORF g.40230 m.40230 type:complete len:123 (+) comp16724_c0_seq2:65-433(+)
MTKEYTQVPDKDTLSVESENEGVIEIKFHDLEIEGETSDALGAFGNLPFNHPFKKLPFWRIWMLALTMLGLHCNLFLWRSVLVPSQVRYVVGDEAKGTALGATLVVGALMSIVSTPFFGILR